MENYFNIISFVVGIVSIVLAVLSIWLGLRSSSESKRLNDDTRAILSQIKEVADITHSIVVGEASENSKHIRDMNTQAISTLIKTSAEAIDAKAMKRK